MALQPQINDAVHVYALANALNDQRKKGQFCDVILKVCGQSLSAHSCVLSACSPYFRSLLVKCPIRPSDDGPSTLVLKMDQPGMIGPLVGLKTGGYEAMGSLLDYMYTGKIYWNEDNVNLIVQLAEAVMLDELANMGRAFISKMKPKIQIPDTQMKHFLAPTSPRHCQLSKDGEQTYKDDVSNAAVTRPNSVSRRTKLRKRSKLLKRHITRLNNMEHCTTSTPPTSSDEQLYFRFKPERRLNLSPRLSGDKPFSCRICLRSFKWEHSLKAHVRLHSKMNYYQCKQCGYRTIHKSSFQSHHISKCNNNAVSHNAVKPVKQTSV